MTRALAVSSSRLLRGSLIRFVKFLIVVGILVVECGRLLLFVLTASTSLILFLWTYSALKLMRLRERLWSELVRDR